MQEQPSAQLLLVKLICMVYDSYSHLQSRLQAACFPYEHIPHAIDQPVYSDTMHGCALLYFVGPFQCCDCTAGQVSS